MELTRAVSWSLLLYPKWLGTPNTWMVKHRNYTLSFKIFIYVLELHWHGRWTHLSRMEHGTQQIGKSIHGKFFENKSVRSYCLRQPQTHSWQHIGVSINGSSPNGWLIMDNPTDMNDLGVPPFQETSTLFLVVAGCFTSCFNLPHIYPGINSKFRLIVWMEEILH